MLDLQKHFINQNINEWGKMSKYFIRPSSEQPFRQLQQHFVRINNAWSGWGSTVPCNNFSDFGNVLRIINLAIQLRKYVWRRQIVFICIIILIPLPWLEVKSYKTFFQINIGADQIRQHTHKIPSGIHKKYMKLWYQISIRITYFHFSVIVFLVIESNSWIGSRVAR